MARSSRRSPILSLLAALLLAGCASTPEGVIEPKRMSRLIADLEIGQSVIDAEPGNYATDSARRALRDAIFLRHSTTAAEYDSSLVWYAHNMDKYVEVLGSSVDILKESYAESMRGSASAVSAGVEAEKEASLADRGDSVNVWPLLPSYRLTASSPRTVIPFSLSRTRNSEPGDIYVLRYRVAGSAAGRASVTASMASSFVGHEGPALSTGRRPGHGGAAGRWEELVMPLDSTRTMTTIYGAITVTGLPASPAELFIDSISLTRLRLSSRSRLRDTTPVSTEPAIDAPMPAQPATAEAVGDTAAEPDRPHRLRRHARQ